MKLNFSVNIILNDEIKKKQKPITKSSWIEKQSLAKPARGI
jgi:hypothetical protein